MQVCGRFHVPKTRIVHQALQGYSHLTLPQFFQGTTVPCVKQNGISQYALAQGGNNGWHVKSVYTTLVTCGGAAIATSDRNFNKWIDGDELASHKRQVLTRV